MAEFNIRTDSVDVEQIMRQIRARIKEKRGVDYTEQQIQELANVKLDRFLDPKCVRSDLVEQFKRTRGTSPEPPNYGFEDSTLYETHRGIVRFIRWLLNPILKLLFNPNPIVHVLHMQGQINNINAQQFRVREELDALYYEVIHNLVLEVTRLGIESKNLKMQLESLNSRIDFDERRARALEGVVQYKPASAGGSREASPPRNRPAPEQRPAPVRPGQQVAQPPRPTFSQPPQVAADTAPVTTAGPTENPVADSVAGPVTPGVPGESTGTDGTVRRRRRRRRGRRGGRGRGPGELAADMAAGGAMPDPAGTPTPGDSMTDASSGPEDAGPDDSGEDEGPDPSEQ